VLVHTESYEYCIVIFVKYSCLYNVYDHIIIDIILCFLSWYAAAKEASAAWHHIYIPFIEAVRELTFVVYS